MVNIGDAVLRIAFPAFRFCYVRFLSLSRNCWPEIVSKTTLVKGPIVAYQHLCGTARMRDQTCYVHFIGLLLALVPFLVHVSVIVVSKDHPAAPSLGRRDCYTLQLPPNCLRYGLDLATVP